jgi:phosphoenolpyruvate carboxykinase (GTP)
MNVNEILQSRLEKSDFDKLMAIDNPKIHEFVAKYVELCNPDRVFVCTDAKEDLARVRQDAIDTGEEIKLAIEGHTIHFDGYKDQARDKAHTKFLVPEGMDLGPNINAIDKKEGFQEVHEILKDIMAGHTMYVRFFALGPTGSEFTIPSMQLTDSSYVAHSLDLLYRQGYEEFKRLGRDARFFRVVHGQGELTDRKVSKNLDGRRIYIDTTDDIVYSTNTQYGGNTLGLKKLSMRLAINRASEEGWLCEHMFLMGIHGPGGRMSYFTGAFPSLCGKTSTSMMVGETIVGDDISYLRVVNGEVRAVNVERGMFGIIMGINPKDDPLIWKTLHSPNEIIFSNILKDEAGKVYWIDMGEEIADKGINHSGEWHKGKTDDQGNEITPSHKNARFTVSLENLENVDGKLHDPAGCIVKGIIYGGRDSDTWMPIRQSFDWTHGIIAMASSLESETTAATLGQEGVRKFNLMSNLDFVSIPLGKYIQANLDFGKKVDTPPNIFGVNYFLKGEDGNFLNAKTDKGIWLKWAELRGYGEVDAIEMPNGMVPKYEDLKRLFKEVQGKDYSHEDYVKQFTLRIPENLAKIERIKKIYEEKVPDTPAILFKVLDEEKKRLEETRAKFGDYVEPEKFLS